MAPGLKSSRGPESWASRWVGSKMLTKGTATVVAQGECEKVDIQKYHGKERTSASSRSTHSNPRKKCHPGRDP